MKSSGLTIQMKDMKFPCGKDCCTVCIRLQQLKTLATPAHHKKPFNKIFKSKINVIRDNLLRVVGIWEHAVLVPAYDVEGSDFHTPCFSITIIKKERMMWDRHTWKKEIRVLLSDY